MSKFVNKAVPGALVAFAVVSGVVLFMQMRRNEARRASSRPAAGVVLTPTSPDPVPLPELRPEPGALRTSSFLPWTEVLPEMECETHAYFSYHGGIVADRWVCRAGSLEHLVFEVERLTPDLRPSLVPTAGAVRLFDITIPRRTELGALLSVMARTVAADEDAIRARWQEAEEACEAAGPLDVRPVGHVLGLNGYVRIACAGQAIGASFRSHGRTEGAR